MYNTGRRRIIRNIACTKYSYSPANRKWLIATLITAGIVLILILYMFFCSDNMSISSVFWMKGFTGVFAVISIIWVAVYYYRIYSAYWNDPNNNNA